MRTALLPTKTFCTFRREFSPLVCALKPLSRVRKELWAWKLNCKTHVHDRYTQKVVLNSLEESQRVTSSQVGFFVSFGTTAFSVSKTKFLILCLTPVRMYGIC